MDYSHVVSGLIKGMREMAKRVIADRQEIREKLENDEIGLTYYDTTLELKRIDGIQEALEEITQLLEGAIAESREVG